MKNLAKYNRALIIMLLLISSISSYGQYTLSVPFSNGFVGDNSGNNSSTNAYPLTSLGLTNVKFSQNSTATNFTETPQGNDIIGNVLITGQDGVEFSIPGFIKWRAPSGNVTTMVFQPAAGTNITIPTNGINGSSSYTITDSTYIGLTFNGQTLTISPIPGTVSGNAATNGLLEGLNAYLGTFISISTSDIIVNEADGIVTLSVTLSAPLTAVASFSYATTDGTATIASGDYTAASGTINLAIGATSAAVDITIIDDSTVESTETFNFVLSNPIGISITDAIGIVSIVDNDSTTPTIIMSGDIAPFSSCQGSVSNEQNFDVSGNNLTADVVVTAPTGFEVSSTSGTNYTSTLTLTQTSGTVTTTTVYVRMTEASVGTPSGNIVLSSASATSQNIAVSGTSKTAPAAPTGPLTQAFCNTATVLDLTATGDTIQWYDASIGGNLLDATTALSDGQMVYASQTIDGCESIDRLEVLVAIQDITISASATVICAGESVDLTAFGNANSSYLWSTGETDSSAQGNLIDEYSLVANTVSQNTFTVVPGTNYRLEIIGTINLGGGAGNQRDVAYYIQSGPDGTTEGTPFDSECELRIWTSLFCDNPGLRPSPDIYDPINHTYSYPFTPSSSSIEVGFWDSPLGDNGANIVTFKLYGLSTSSSSITVTPTETTEYWVDVTTNGVTCREYVTINVTAPAAPTGSPVQGGCSDHTVGSNNNAFDGENLQWYDTALGGSALSDDYLLIDGAFYYISQTIDGCESIDRFEFQYLAPEPTITIVSPVICEGESATVSVTSSPFVGTATFLWNTGETSEFITLSPTESTTYWVDQIYNSGSPENIQTVCRYFFGVAVDQAPDSPISGGDITECETIAAQNLVATATANVGETIMWYDSSIDGVIVIDPSLSTVGTVTYYAETSVDVSGCPSLFRTPVTLTITSIAAPTGDAVQSFCDSVVISDLLVTGDNIQWYDSATGGTLLDGTTDLIDGQLVYASQTLDGCESLDRLGVSVVIDIITDPILITTELDFCLAREATLADLEIDAQGFELEWYDSYTGGTLLGLDTILEDATSYYATLYDVLTGCESLMRLEVIPTVIPCEVIIYNAISLNDNGLNDYMVIENAEYFPFNTLEIFNRDGYLVYNQRKYGVGDNLFRGMANVGGIYSQGSNLPTGSYLYVFTYYNPYEQQEFVKKGFLTINNN